MSDSATPWIVVCQAPLSMGFSRQKYWSRLPLPPPGDLPNPGIKPTSLSSSALAGGFFTTEPPGMPPGMIIFVIVLGPWGPYPFILLIVFWFPLVTSCLLLGAASDWAFTSVKLLCFTPVGRQTYSSSSLYSLIRT